MKSESAIQTRDAIEAAASHGRRPFTERDREDMIRSVIGSQALEGIELSWEDVARIVDEVLAEPPLSFPADR
jgi:hypothetical protein